MSLSDLNWNSPIRSLVAGKKSKTIDKLNGRGFHTLLDLLWVLPLKTLIIPKVQSFDRAYDGSIFKGVGKVLASRDQANFKARGKGSTPLSNVTLTVQDRFSEFTISLKWFNCYPSQVKALKELKYIFFTGSITSFNGQVQAISPDYEELTSIDFEKDLKMWSENDKEKLKVTYPTIDGISPHHIAGVFNKIPSELWESIPESLPEEITSERGLLPLGKAFKIIHGKVTVENFSESIKDEAFQRLIYQEFFQEQVKINLRKKNLRSRPGISIEDKNWEESLGLFPYELTDDQKKALEDITLDLTSGSPMMRLIQGDVGSGKTSVAILSAILMNKNGYQTAIMCPTESLALQHFLTFKELLGDSIEIDILLGSQSKKEKTEVVKGLVEGTTKIVIGTHSLFQETVIFDRLGLAIIDEQHKFGVEQRLKLVNKGEGCHCLLMTATPIPRSLSLTQYGDLDLSLIKQMPSNRKGTQTRIVSPQTYGKYLSFLKTRINMGEQAYIVVPAIEENPEQDMLNLEVVLKKYREYFPDYKIEGLHGKMKAEEKNKAFIDFREKNIDLLISTSVIEVGINNPNATVMTILNPERFGLSSLHQMRGRVGRGEKPGFCFLVNDRQVSENSLERLSVIEKNSDGFIIAEEDLRIRGEGDLFGKDQSGVKTTRILSSLIQHQETLELAKKDVETIQSDFPELYKSISKNFQADDILNQTI